MNRGARNPNVKALAEKLAGMGAQPTAGSSEEAALHMLRLALGVGERGLPPKPATNWREGPKDAYAFWLTKAKPGETFICLASDRNFNLYGTQARNYGRKVTTETVTLVSGPRAAPEVRVAYVITMQEGEDESNTGADGPEPAGNSDPE